MSDIVDVVIDGADATTIDSDGNVQSQTVPTGINANYVCQFFNLKDGATDSISGRRDISFGAPAWTPDQFNASSFGVTYQLKGGPSFALIDEISVGILYAVPANQNNDDDNPLDDTSGNAWLGVAVNNQGVVALVGDAGRIYRTTVDNIRNNIPPTPASAPQLAASITDVVWARDRFVAVGMGGVALFSYDGENWTRFSTGITDPLMGVCYSPNARKAVAVGFNNSRFIARLT